MKLTIDALALVYGRIPEMLLVFDYKHKGCLTFLQYLIDQTLEKSLNKDSCNEFTEFGAPLISK